MKLVAVTSCPTGIAHTYMAAEAIAEAAKAAGHEIHVETQGSAGVDEVDAATIAACDAVILAADVEVRGRHRFEGKPVITATVKQGIHHAADLVEQAVTLAAAAPKASTNGAAPAGLATKVPAGAGFGGKLRGWLMTGVSYMIPFVAAGGILIALAFLFGGADIANQVNGGTFDGKEYEAITDITAIWEQVGLAGVLFKIGATAFSMLVPVLAGFIAYAMADRQGLVPGFVAGLLANAIGAGFLGGLVGGLLAGALVMYLAKLAVPRALQGIMPVVVVPLVSTGIIGIVMIAVIGEPIATVTTELTDWLNGLGDTNAVLLGLLLGAMMAFDMGGPVNKVAYTFALASLASGNTKIMAAVMAAGMVPPLALALATVVRKKLFTESERKAGEAAWLLGASFITEGAIPFAAADPLRVIPSIMAGSAVTGALSMVFDATSRAPHGGIFVVGLIGNPLLYVIAIAAGVVVSATLVVVLKSARAEVPVTEQHAAVQQAVTAAEPVAA